MKPKEVKRYYYKLVNDEFRQLQLDENLKNKSVFDLIDYCELLYENLANSIRGDESSLKYYIKGYLIFNYFINSFIMLHFDGFDQFISTNEYDFIIYLNVFAFYNTDDIIDTSAYQFPLTDLRQLILDYLDDRNLLRFDVNELYAWLYEYIDYLKKKDQYTNDVENSDLDPESQDKHDPYDDFNVEDVYTEYLEDSKKDLNTLPNMQTLNIDDSKSSVYEQNDSLDDFQHRFPSVIQQEYSSNKMTAPLNHISPAPKVVDHEKAVASKSSKHSVRPPIPTSLPPGLPLALQEHKNLKPKTNGESSSTPYPMKHDYLSDVKEAPYPIKRDISNDELYFEQTNNTSPPSVSPPSLPPPLVSANTESALYDRVRQSRPYANFDNETSNSTSNLMSNNYKAVSSRPMPPIPTSSAPQPQLQSLQSVPINQMSIPFPMTPLVQNNLGYSNQPPPFPGSMPPLNQYGINNYPSQASVAHSQMYPSNFQTPPPPQQPYQNWQPAQQPYGYQNMQPPYSNQNINGKNKRMQEYCICGLKNFGSSCYINSTIQLLFGVKEFKMLFTNLEYNKYIKDPKFIAAKKNHANNSKDSVLLSEAVSGLVKSFKLHGGASIAPTKFIRISSLLKPDLNIPYEQQDSQEFLLFILDRLHEELSDKTSSGNASNDLSLPLFENYIRMWGINILPDELEGYFKWYKSLIEYEGNSPIHDLFEGHLQNKLICDKCGFQSINYSPFTILSLPIPSNRNNDNVDLSECLRYYTQDEMLRGENAWKCPKCSKQIEDKSVLDNHPVFTKKPGIFKLGRRSKSPSKESKASQKGKEKEREKSSALSIKKLNFIKLPKILFIHLSRFSVFNLTDKLNTNIIYPSQLKFNNYSKTGNADRNRNNNGGQITYKLMGIINHYGNLKSGHYTSLVNKSDNKQYWCYFDDESVKLNINHGEYHHKLQSRDVYVLCYERI